MDHALSRRRVAEVLLVALRLGLTSFGGPTAHLAHFEREYVQRRRWLSGEEYVGLLALCQLLPGPTSSQVGFLVGLHRAGWWGALAAWLGFTLPSALLLSAAATLAPQGHGPIGDAVVHGLKLVAVPVVAHAVLGMARRHFSGATTVALAIVSLGFALLPGCGAGQVLAIATGAAGGAWLMKNSTLPALSIVTRVRPAVAWIALAMFCVLLVGLPLAARLDPDGDVALAERFYRAGALVFGGGHVVLPLLRDALVPGGWIGEAQFLTGYGLAQAVPGPMFTIAAWLGAMSPAASTPLAGATVALLAIFLPGLLLAAAGIPLWQWVSRHRAAAGALAGINAAVVGLLAAALYDPVWTGAVLDPFDVVVAAAGFLLLERSKIAPVVVVALCVVASAARLAWS